MCVYIDIDIDTDIDIDMGFPGGSVVKNLPEMQETLVQFLDWEDPREKEMAAHSSILGLENPMDRGIWWAIVHAVAKSRTQLSNSAHTHI